MFLITIITIRNLPTFRELQCFNFHGGNNCVVHQGLLLIMLSFSTQRLFYWNFIEFVVRHFPALSAQSFSLFLQAHHGGLSCCLILQTYLFDGACKGNLFLEDFRYETVFSNWMCPTTSALLVCLSTGRDTRESTHLLIWKNTLVAESTTHKGVPNISRCLDFLFHGFVQFVKVLVILIFKKGSMINSHMHSVSRRFR